MEVAELVTRRNDFQAALTATVLAAVSRFNDETGVNIKAICIDFEEVNLDGEEKPFYALMGVRVKLDI